jgi:hypothetical protein
MNQRDVQLFQFIATIKHQISFPSAKYFREFHIQPKIFIKIGTRGDVPKETTVDTSSF